MHIKGFIKNISKKHNLDIYPDAIIMINALNDIIGWNVKAEKLFGYLESEITGRGIAIIFDNDVEKIHQALFEKTSQILNAKNREGKDIIVEIACSDYNKDGKIMISVKDVTKSQKVIEKLLLEYEKVSKVAQNKGGFVASHSSDLKSPIHSIISFSQGLLDGVCGQIDEKQEKYVNIINKNAINLLTLVDNMIFLSQLEANQIQLEQKVFDITELLEAVKNDINHLIQEKNIKFDIDYSVLERRTIYSDETILRQVLLNLFINSVKFTDMGDVKIRLTHPDIEMVEHAGIQTVPYFTNKSYILFSVTLPGIGISEEDRQKIFEEYNNTTGKSFNKKHGGAGLSFAITKKLTAILGGNIWASSNFDKGTNFSFIIPVERILTSLMPKQEG